MRFKESEENNKFSKSPKHRPNQPGVGMRILNEHDADDVGPNYLSENDADNFDPYAPDGMVDPETFEKYLKKS